MIRSIGKACALFAWLVGLLAFPAAAQIPATMHYQGVLTNAAGAPLNEPVSMTIFLYDVAAMGMPLWGEAQGVQVVNGLFDVQLGAGMPIVGGQLSALPFDRPYYLELNVNGETLSPRQPVLTAPYAQRAAIADGIIATKPLIVGADAITLCDPGKAGAIRWNNAISQLQMCDGGGWRVITVGPQTFTVGGFVMGATGPLILSNNGSTMFVQGDGTYTFPSPLNAGAQYSVTVYAPPPGQACSVANGVGVIGMSSVTDVSVICSTPQPLLRYAFEGSGSNSGTLAGLNMTLTNASFVAGKVGNAVSFAAGGYGQVASGMRAAIGNNAKVTIAFWMKQSAPLNGQAFFDVRNSFVAPYGGIQLGQVMLATSLCVSTTTNVMLGGSCSGPASPSIGDWHHWIIRYSGSGTGAGQGGPTEVFVDGFLVLTRANDMSNNPVFTADSISDALFAGAPSVTIDELVLYNRTFTDAEQCSVLLNGSWNGMSCMQP